MNKIINFIKKYNDIYQSLPLLFQCLIMSGITFTFILTTVIVDLWVI